MTAAVSSWAAQGKASPGEGPCQACDPPAPSGLQERPFIKS